MFASSVRRLLGLLAAPIRCGTRVSCTLSAVHSANARAFVGAVDTNESSQTSIVLYVEL
jgi:hypothetical protein